MSPDACQGCGHVDPMGIHFLDCALKEPGDGLIHRDADGLDEILWVEGPEQVIYTAPA